MRALSGVRSSAPAADHIALSTRGDLDAGMPLHMVQQKLINGGMNEQTAQQLEAIAADAPLVRCEKCDFFFRQTVQHCCNCGGELLWSAVSAS